MTIELILLTTGTLVALLFLGYLKQRRKSTTKVKITYPLAED